MSIRQIGLIGFGTIGRGIQARLDADPGYRLTVLLRPESVRRASVPAGVAVVTTLDDLLASRPDLVVEAAGHAALAQAAPGVLAAGIPLVPASVGALSDTGLLARLTEIAEGSGARLLLPSGAVGGLDYIAAIREDRDASIRYTSRKPPAAWTDELAQAGLTEQARSAEVVLFEGPASEAARLYPKNLNVGLTLALAAGPARLTTRIVSDPNAAGNTHEIEVESAFGTAQLRFVNLPSPDNPKTSAVTAASLVAAVRRHFATIGI